MKFFFAWFYWDPSPYVIILPYIGLPLTWYGLLFAFGFWVGFHIFVKLFKQYLCQKSLFLDGDVDWSALATSNAIELINLEKGDITSCNDYLQKTRPCEEKRLTKEDKRLLAVCKRMRGKEESIQLRKRMTLEKKYPKIFLPLKWRAKDFAEKLILYVIGATIIGARLGHVLFYESFSEYLSHPLSFFKTWEGGLASHGGVVAIIIALWLFRRSSRKKYPDFTWYHLLDRIAIPTMFVAGLIRVGNFFNQEILGMETQVPWAVIFGHPADGSPVLPRHPAQLYESVFYFGVFALLMWLWKHFNEKWPAGRFAGMAIFLSFAFRFVIEFIKVGQSRLFDHPESWLLMGQWLSLPLAAIGLFFLLKPAARSSRDIVL